MTTPDTLKKKVRRLHDVDVTHVSLVDRPANRTKFKFIKRDGSTAEEGQFPMNHMLKTLFGARSVAVASVIANTEAKAMAVAKMLLPDGATVEVTNTEGVFVAREQGVAASADERLVHMGKTAGVAYTLSNLAKELQLYGMDVGTFDEAVKQEGFVPGIMIGMEALNITIRNIAMSEDTKDADTFRAGVKKAMTSFASYVDDLITSLPEKAFKFEKALVAIGGNTTASAALAGQGFTNEVYDAVFGTGASPDVATGATSAAPVAAVAEAGETPAADAGASVAPAKAPEGQTAGAVAEAAKAEEPAAPANLQELPAGTAATDTRANFETEMKTALTDFAKSLTTQVAEGLTKVTESVAALGARMDKQDGQVATLAKAVGGTVAGAPAVDPDNKVVPLVKGEQGDIPLMDTAYRAKRG